MSGSQGHSDPDADFNWTSIVLHSGDFFFIVEDWVCLQSFFSMWHANVHCYKDFLDL